MVDMIVCHTIMYVGLSMPVQSVHDCTMYMYVGARGPDGPAWPHVCRGWHQLPRLPGLNVKYQFVIELRLFANGL